MASRPLSKSMLSFSHFFSRRLATPFWKSHYKQLHALSLNNENNNNIIVSNKTLLVCEVEGVLLRTSFTFPYFMLVALEAGSFLRGLFLLLLYPLICCLGQEVGIRVMVFVCFCGIKVERFKLGLSVLPKFFLEDVGFQEFGVLKKARKCVCVSSLPRVMVEGFLKEYLEVDFVVGKELEVFGGYFNGFMQDYKKKSKVIHGSLELKDHLLGGDEFDVDHVVGLKSCKKSIDHPVFSLCKAVYQVSEADKRKWVALPRDQYPKPLVFHDGRIAFRPTPMNTLVMFLWLPFGILLAIFRSLIYIFLPLKIAVVIGSATGITTRVLNRPINDEKARGRLFVCNHRTLLDPIYVSIGMNKPINAVTYSISPITEVISPIKTVRMAREAAEDKRIMEGVLSQGDLVVCPEGTTCREPYLLRFSPLFTEVSDEVIPVALMNKTSMFYATTAAGLKSLDHLYFLMNPKPVYVIEFLEKIRTRGAFSEGCDKYQIANLVQEKIAKALGFQCTTLTRKQKYQMLVGTEGVVKTKPKSI